MILSRVIEHVRAQNWTAILLDFVIVVTGVFIGIQVSNWNAARLDDARAREFVNRLTGDFEAIDQRLQASISVFEQSLDAIDLVYQRVENGNPPETAAEDAQFAEALRNTTTSRVPAWSSATFLEMQSAGELGLLTNPALRSALIEYDQQSEISEKGWTLLTDRQLAYLDPIYDAVRFAPDLAAVDGNESFHVTEFDFERMRDNPAFLTALSAQIQVQSNNRVLQEQQLAKAENVLKILRGEKR
jgi:hypothetical protein